MKEEKKQINRFYKVFLCLTFWLFEVAQGWQGEDGRGDNVDGVVNAVSVMPLAAFNATYND